ncbi:hypothetical protein [Zooshikella ganghwensis]|uniref:WD40 repeat domain-containing protein n=1 Tax=Zooshikella ganghwensis TaxID=202772 RepID=A0A4P9VP78_9GAMM|nr:hypothetical protein [Zooshikella ganghwensis]RDH44726.1 hypothetical protein B9G39_15500 [Zooshikella ganghwensis]
MPKSIFITIISLVLITGCEQSSEQQPAQRKEAANAEASSSQAMPQAPELKVIKEDISDSSLYKEPRIQFIWDAPPNREDGKDEVWSMSLNGDELRQVASHEELICDEDGRTGQNGTTVVRSPNNRYLAYAWSPFGPKYLRCILDLKTRKTTVIADSVGIPSFNWSQDSRFLYFLDGRAVKKYDLKTNKLSDYPHQFGTPMYLYENDTKVFARDDQSLKIYDFKSGKLLKEWNTGERLSHTYFQGSPSTHQFTYLSTINTSKKGLYSFNNPLKPIFEFKRPSTSLIGPAGKFIYLYRMSQTMRWIEKVNIETGETIKLSLLPKTGKNRYRVFNLTVYNNKHSI